MSFYIRSPIAWGIGASLSSCHHTINVTIFSGYSSNFVLVCMFELCSDSVWLYLLRHTRGMQALCFSLFVRHRASDATVAQPRAVLYTSIYFFQQFFQQLWQQHLNKTGWSETSEMFCKTAHRKDTVYLQGKQCHL